ncbi:unnamed protein product [Closterium sp. NIES-65]|nr:unnamed protein product [Closterium sp. NIES-65]
MDGANSRLENADAAGDLLATDLALTLTPPAGASRRGDAASLRDATPRFADEAVLSRSASSTRPAAAEASSQLERFPTSNSRTRSPPAAGGSLAATLGMSLVSTTTDANRPAKAPSEALQQVRQQQQQQQQQHPEHLQEYQLQEILFRSRPFSPSLLVAESAGRFSARQPNDVFLNRGAANAPNSAVPPPTRPPHFFAAPSGARRAPFSTSPDSPGGSNIPPAPPPAAAPLTYDAAAVVVDSVAQFPGAPPATTAPFSSPPLPLARASAPAAPSPTSAPTASASASYPNASAGSAAELALARLLGAPGGNAGVQENLPLLARLWGAAGPVTAPLAQSKSERGTEGAEGGEEGEAVSAEAGEDAEGSGNKRKMRLSQEQQSTMEAVFRKTPRLTPREKSALAGQLGVRVRQVEVWFQNRRARTKVKDTEVELDGLRRRCQTLADENRRLRERLSVSGWALTLFRLSC